MSMVYVLGEQRVSGAAEARAGAATSSRAIELLAYLALHAGRAQSRTHLASLLWPDSSEQQARTNLRRELHNVRNLPGCDTALRTQGPTLTWVDTPSCSVDVRVFQRERTAALAAETEPDPTAFLQRAEAAIDTYHGDLMPGSYEDWVLEERDLLRRHCVELCDAVTLAWRDAGHPDRAVRYARKRIELEPLEEVGYRTLMELQSGAGDRAAAMSTYHRLASALETGLGVTPDTTTTRLFEKLVGGGTANRESGLAPARAVPSGHVLPALIGREEECEALHRRWRQSVDGRQGLLLVSGESGVGKTRLLSELGEAVRAEGAVVSTARCFGPLGSVALAPVAEWLRSPGLRSGFGSLEPVWRREIVRLVPGAGTGDSAAPPTESSRAMVDAWQRHRFFEGLARGVLSAGRPVLLVLDDLQWCDAETITWLAFLLSLEPGSRVLVAASARKDEVDSRSEIRDALRGLRAAGLLTDVSLSPLTTAGTVRLARSLGGRALSPAEESVLQAATGGYPIHVVEAARILPESAATGERTAGQSLRADDLTEILHRRIEQCSEAAREVAGLAAALGQNFDLDLLSEATDLDTDTLVRAVDELWRRRILRPQGSGYDFVHTALRDAAYRSVGPPRRWLLHRRLAQGLELLYSGHTDNVAAQLAEQYLHGGRPDRALHYFERAAAVAASVFAHAEALRHYHTCLDLIERLPAGHSRDGRELGVRQAMSAPLTARDGYSAPELQATLERTVELAQRLRRPKTVLAGLIGLFAAHFVQGHTALAYHLGERALQLSQTEPEFAGQAHFAVAGSALGLGRPAIAVEHFDLASDLFSDEYSFILGTRLEVHCLAWASHAQWLTGDERRAIASIDEALELARASGHPYSLAVALGYAAILHQIRGDRVALAPTLDELRELCARYQFAYYSQWASILGGWLDGGEKGITRIQAALSTLRRQRALARMPYWLFLLAEVSIESGRIDAGRATLDAARICAAAHDDRWWLPQVLRLRASLDRSPAGNGDANASRTVRS
ncbi:MAG: AAA family ATPase [Rhodococcus sp. (in: high G+C Gram-positive bacteria)]|uniref:ATP-binding protein n=1 Tax=Rhodococcus sp. TaxID=1831 RepID=UPI003BAECCDF